MALLATGSGAVLLGGTSCAAILRGGTVIWQAAAHQTGPTPLLQIDPTSYTGPALNGTLPAAVGGYRTLSAADPAPVDTALALTNNLYWVMSGRLPAGTGMTVLAFNSAAYGAWPGVWLLAPTWSPNYYISFEYGSPATNTFFDTGYAMDTAPHVFELMVEGDTVSFAIDGGTLASGTTGGNGLWTMTDLYFARAEGGVGEPLDIAGLRVFDAAPSSIDRAAQRTWAQGLIPA